MLDFFQSQWGAQGNKDSAGSETDRVTQSLFPRSLPRSRVVNAITRDRWVISYEDTFVRIKLSMYP